MIDMRSGALALATVAFLGLADLAAQEAPRPRHEGMHRGPTPEMILSLRDGLELTDDQITALDEIRERMVSVRTSHRAAMADIRSRFEAGELDRLEMREAMEAVRSSGPDFHREIQGRIEAILDEGQLETLEELRPRRGGEGAMGPRGGRRGPEGGMTGPGRMGGPDMGAPGMERPGMRGMRGGGGPAQAPMGSGACRHGGSPGV